MSDSITTFYLFYGDDSLALDEAVNKLRQSALDESPNAELNMDTFDGDEATVPQVLNAVRSFPFLADKRVVFVYDLITRLMRRGASQADKDALQRLLDALPDLPQSARLVMVERGKLRKDSKIITLTTEHDNGYCRAFEAPEDTTGWIIQRAKHEYGAQIDRRAAVALASVTSQTREHSSDLRRADNELLKLVAYVDGERPINEHDVALLTPYVPETNVFRMIDALIAGNGARALTLLHNTLEQNPRDPGFGLFALITRQFRLLLLTREHLDQGGSRDGKAIADAIGIRSGWQGDKLANQSRAFSQEKLESIYRLLQKYDVEMKTGQIEPRMALELLVTGLAR